MIKLEQSKKMIDLQTFTRSEDGRCRLWDKNGNLFYPLNDNEFKKVFPNINTSILTQTGLEANGFTIKPMGSPRICSYKHLERNEDRIGNYGGSLEIALRDIPSNANAFVGGEIIPGPMDFPECGGNYYPNTSRGFISVQYYRLEQ